MIDIENKIVLDFEGVRNMNASFSNALFGNLSRLYGKKLFEYVSCINLRENVKREIIFGVKMGSVKQFQSGREAPTMAFSKYMYT